MADATSSKQIPTGLPQPGATATASPADPGIPPQSLTGSGPLGQSGINPSSTIRYSYEAEFVEGRQPRIVTPLGTTDPETPEPRAKR